MNSVSNLKDISLNEEIPADAKEVDFLSAVAFGPGRFARSAFRLREGVPHEPALSFVAREKSGELVGSVRLTKVMIGGQVAILLGPLVVTGRYKNKGLGALLMRTSIEAAKHKGFKLIILVGDLPYYERFGFKIAPAGRYEMPAPVARSRLLYCELSEGAASEFSGVVSRHVISAKVGGVGSGS